MSSNGEVDTQAHQAFDPEPTTVLSAGEPHTPLWLPAVGVALFGAASLWAFSGDETDTVAEPSKPVASASTTASARPPKPAAKVPTGADRKRIRARLEAAKRRGALPPRGKARGH